MSLKTLELEFGALHSPADVAHLFPGNSAKRVRDMCASGELTCTIVTGPAGGPRYWISDADVRKWRREHRSI